MQAQQGRTSGWVPRYLRTIGETRSLDRDRERMLARRARNDRNAEAHDQLILGNLRFAFAYCRKFQGMGLSLEELVAEAHLGLIEAADRFDPNRNVRFISYAMFWILRAVFRALASNASQIPLPQKVYARRRAVQDARRFLRERLVLERRFGLKDDSPMTLSEVSRLIGVSREMVRLIEARARGRLRRRFARVHRAPGRAPGPPLPHAARSH